MNKKIHIFPLNRVEGDLKIQLELEDGVVSDARSSGIMYRGFENIMVGRGPLDGLVITPRICGICSTAHLKAASKALDMVCNVCVPDNAKRIRNITLMVEKLQNDVRHAFLVFMTDFGNPYHKGHSLYEDAVRRYEPLKGLSAIRCIEETKNLLEIIAILGGQWPHSSFMVPGGVVSAPSTNNIIQCGHLLKTYRKWYESQVMGCHLERWLEVKSRSDLDTWLDECDTHRESDIGFYIRFSKEAGLEKIGKGHENFISFGSLDMPEHTDAHGFRKRLFPDIPVFPCDPEHGKTFLPSGFAAAKGNCLPEISAFQQEKITEDVEYSWFNSNGTGGHPFDNVTVPYATGSEGKKYSWAKAPRYDGSPAETGPLAEMIIAGHPLFTDLVKSDGPNVFVRELARLVRTAVIIPLLELWLREMTHDSEGFFQSYDDIEDGDGFGLIEAPRGALGHWIKIRGAKIEKYQIITPTAWNGSPKDSAGIRGPWEEAVIGTEIRDTDNPVEVGHIIRSFDPCLVCAVHAVTTNGEL